MEAIIASLLCCGFGIGQFLFNRRLVVAPVRNTKKLKFKPVLNYLSWGNLWMDVLMKFYSDSPQ